MSVTSLLEQVDVDILSIKNQVYDTIRTFYSTENAELSVNEAIEFASSFLNPSMKDGNGSNSILQTLDQLEKELGQQIELMQGTSEESLNWKNVERQKSTEQLDIEKRTLKVKMLKDLMDIDEKLVLMEECMENQSSWKEMNMYLMEVDVVYKRVLGLDEQQNDDVLDVPLAKALYYQILNLHTRYETEVLECLLEIVQVNVDGTLQITMSGENNRLEHIWTTIENMHTPSFLVEDEDATSKLVSTLTLIGNKLVDYLLDPIFSESTRTTVQVQEYSNSVTIDIGKQTATTEPMTIDALLGQFTSVLKAVFKHVLCGRKAYMRQIALLSWPKCSRKFTKVLETNLPIHVGELEEFKATQKSKFVQLEKILVDIGYLDNDQPGGMQDICSFIDNIRTIYAETKRKHYLMQSQHIMKKEYVNYASTLGESKTAQTLSSNKKVAKKQGSIDESAFFFNIPVMDISVCVKRILELVHVVLTEAIRGGTDQNHTVPFHSDGCQLLFRTSREIVLLFHTIVPLLYKQKIQNDARSVMLFHNDCQYLAHHMLTLGYEYQSMLLENHRSTPFTLVDIVPILRQCGLDKLNAYVDKVIENIRIATTGENSLLENLASLQVYEKHVNGVVYEIEKLVQIWKSGMSTSVFEKLLGSIVNAALSNVNHQIFSLREFPEATINQLHSIYHAYLSVETFFESSAKASLHSESYATFASIYYFLDPMHTLSDILNMQKKQQFHGLTRYQALELIRLIYPDSPERTRTIQSIEQHL